MQSKDGETGIHEHVAPDAMGFSLNYYTGDYTSRTANGNDFLTDLSSLQSGTTYNQLYNGNISMMATALMDNNETALELSANHYKYDQLHRIKGMKSFLSGTGGSYTYLNASSDATDQYGTSYTFDGNGNLIDLTRRAENGSGSGALMDDFSYLYYTDDYSTTYDPSASIPVNATNRLAYVTDASPNAGTWSTDIDGQSSGNYEYDEIGQLLRDNAEEISKIEWLVTNKVSKVIHNASTKDDLEFLYDAGGNRVVKIVKPKDGTTLSDEDQWTFTYYVRDASGNVLTTYTKKTKTVTDGYIEKFAADEHHLYGSKRLGLSAAYNPAGYLDTTYATWSNTGSSGGTDGNGYFITDDLVANGSIMPSANTVNAAILAHQIGLRSYECSNHLGNVLAVVSDKPIEADGNADNLIDGLLADVVSFSDYYPYGMQMPGRNGSTSGYRYGFNGMEKDPEWNGEGNSYTTEFRQYDPRVGRWLSLDPLMAQFPDVSAYVAYSNNPIYFIDPTGLAPVDPGKGNKKALKEDNNRLGMWAQSSSGSFGEGFVRGMVTANPGFGLMQTFKSQKANLQYGNYEAFKKQFVLGPIDPVGVARDHARLLRGEYSVAEYGSLTYLVTETVVGGTAGSGGGSAPKTIGKSGGSAFEGQTLANYIENTPFWESSIADELDGVTTKSSEVAQNIRNGKVTLNIFDDATYDAKFGKSAAAASGEHILLRANSRSFLTEIMHEGVHATDYVNGYGKGVLKSVVSWEIRARFYERQFQLRHGLPVDFAKLDAMIEEVKSEYEDAIYDPYTN